MKAILYILRACLIAVFVASFAWAANIPDQNQGPVQKTHKDKHPKPAGWIAKDQAAALQRTGKKVPYIQKVLLEDLPLRQQRLRKLGLGIKNIQHSYMVLNSPYVNSYEDKYGPVRFMHSQHAARLNEDCALCHHYRPLDAKAKETVACKACHQDTFNPERQQRMGLKAAYHNRCMGCHQKMHKGPVSCQGCHLTKVPDHTKLVKLPDNPTPFQVTKECLRCHKDAGQEMLASAHWLWRGPSPYTVGRRKQVSDGKGTSSINNF